MINQISSYSAICNTVSELYGIGKVTDAGKVYGGKMGNNFWIVTSDAKYFLREYRPYSEDRIKEIHTAKNYFHTKGIPAVLPLQTIKGQNTYFRFEDDTYALFPFVNGVQVPATRLDLKHYANLGTFLAQMHSAGTQEQVGDVVQEKERAWDTAAFLKKASKLLQLIESRVEKDRFDVDAIEQLRYKMAMVKEDNVAYRTKYALHLTHNDYHEDNLFFDEEKRVKHIFDWEKVQSGTRAKEVTRALELMAFRDGYTDEAFLKARTFLDWYRQSYPMDADEFYDGVEKRFMNLAHSTWIEEEHYKGNCRVDSLLEQTSNQLKYYSKNMSEYVDRLFR